MAYLFSDERYLARLHDSYHYLIVDDIDETVPVAQDLIVDFLKKAKGVFLAYNPRGGHTDFFGAYPEGVEKNILPLCRVQEQKNENCEGDMEVFAGSLEGILRGKTVDVKEHGALKWTDSGRPTRCHAGESGEKDNRAGGVRHGAGRDSGYLSICR
jgi:hypothetical protein